MQGLVCNNYNFGVDSFYLHNLAGLNASHVYSHLVHVFACNLAAQMIFLAFCVKALLGCQNSPQDNVKGSAVSIPVIFYSGWSFQSRLL